MATSNPADAVNWSDQLGRLKEEHHGDVLITTEREPDPYRNLMTAIERDVLFVSINGEPFYGTSQLMEAAGAQNAEDIEVGPLRRKIVLIYPGIPDADIGWQAVVDALRLARRDPQAARARSEAEADERGPLELRPDKEADQGKQVPLSEATKGKARAPLSVGSATGLPDPHVSADRLTNPGCFHPARSSPRARVTQACFSAVRGVLPPNCHPRQKSDFCRLRRWRRKSGKAADLQANQ